MKNQTDLVESSTFEAIPKFARAATGGEVAATQESFMRQAELFRRNGDAGRAAFWEAMADRIAEAAGQKPGEPLEFLPE